MCLSEIMHPLQKCLISFFKETKYLIKFPSTFSPLNILYSSRDEFDTAEYKYHNSKLPCGKISWHSNVESGPDLDISRPFSLGGPFYPRSGAG